MDDCAHAVRRPLDRWDAGMRYHLRRRRTLRVVLTVLGLAVAAPTALAQNPPEEIEYYATDALGSVRIVFTSAGQVLGRSDYLPFGETLNQNGTLPRQRFTGQERDGEAGMDYFRARNLLASTGRMNAPDPLFVSPMASPQRWNRYSYVANNPLRFVDPSGRESEAAGTGSMATFKTTVVGYLPHPCLMMPAGSCVLASPSPRETSSDLGMGETFHNWAQSLSVASMAYFGSQGTAPPIGSGTTEPKSDPGSGGNSGTTTDQNGQQSTSSNGERTGSPGCPSVMRRTVNNIVMTNTAIPGALAPPLLGAVTGVSGQVARSLGMPTTGQLFKSLFTGSAVIAGGAEWTMLEGVILAIPPSAVSFLAVGSAFEVGVAVGSFLDAALFDPCSRR